MTTANLALPELIAAQAQKHVTVNEALRALDALVHLAVLDRDLSAPPGDPAEGARWIVAAGGSGDWDGHDGEVAAWQDGGWSFYAPQIGWLAYVVDEGALIAWTGSAWADAIFTPAALHNMTLFGVGTTADATNPFSAKLNNALWVAKSVAEGGDGTLRYKMSKESADKTLSLLFQDNFSGRAEVGLTGDDDFHFKVSPDGTSWIDAITIANATGKVSFPAQRVRDVLSADRTYYVRTDGDDANGGLADTAGGAFATIQHAADIVYGTLDLSGYDVTIQIGDGSYTAGAWITGAQVGAGRIVFQGNAATPGNVAVASAGTYAFRAEAGCFMVVKAMKLGSSTNGCLQATKGGKIYFSNVAFDACPQFHVRADENSLCYCEGNYAITAGAGQSHWGVVGGGCIRAQSKTITITGTPNFPQGFASATTTGTLFVNGNTYVGSVTGAQYSVTSNGILQVSGGTLPGDAAGAVATGGQVV
jgi:hypothetical protein